MGRHKEWDVATNLADGWVFDQGIAVAKRRCRPDLSLAWAKGSASGGNIAMAEGWEPRSSLLRLPATNITPNTAPPALSYSRVARLPAAKPLPTAAFCKVVGNGNAITFYKNSTSSCSKNGCSKSTCRHVAGTISLQGAKLSGSASGFSSISAALRRISFSGTDADGRSQTAGSLRFLP